MSKIYRLIFLVVGLCVLQIQAMEFPGTTGNGAGPSALETNLMKFEAGALCLCMMCKVGAWACKKMGCCTAITQRCDQCEDKIVEEIQKLSALFLCQTPAPAARMGDNHEHAQ